MQPLLWVQGILHAIIALSHEYGYFCLFIGLGLLFLHWRTLQTICFKVTCWAHVSYQNSPTHVNFRIYHHSFAWEDIATKSGKLIWANSRWAFQLSDRLLPTLGTSHLLTAQMYNFPTLFFFFNRSNAWHGLWSFSLNELPSCSGRVLVPSSLVLRRTIFCHHCCVS